MALPPKSKEIVEYCQAAEGLGFDSLWVIDRLFGELPVLEPFTVMTLAVASTQRVGIGSCVILAALRQPVWLAKEIATLDYLSGGRVVLGISLGGNQQAFDAVGFPLRQRTRRLEEAITIMRKLWNEDNVTWHGRYSQLQDATINPKPVQSHLPILLGAAREPALRRAGVMADGWIANAFSTPQQCRERWEMVKTFAQAGGRDPSSLQCGKLLYCWVDDDRTRARQAVSSFYQAHYPNIHVEDFAACGPPEECAHYIQQYIDAGARTIILGPTGLDIHQLELLTERVLPLMTAPRP